MKLTGRMSHRISYVFNYPGIIFYAMKHWNLKEVEKKLNELEASNPAIVAMDRASLSKDDRTFVFDGTAYPYFYHPYNNTQRNERSIEVPIIWDQVCRSREGAILEIGNVLSHYFDVSHMIVDKYEVAPGVANIDVVDLDQTPRFDLSKYLNFGTCRVGRVSQESQEVLNRTASANFDAQAWRSIDVYCSIRIQ